MPSPNPSTLCRYFAGIAESTFQTQLGVADPPLIDYISDLLARFIRSEALFRVRNLAGRPVGEVAGMLVEAQQRVGDAQREVHRHIGDYTLFWSGVYPEALQRLRGTSHSDQLVDFCAEGRRAYWIASTIETDQPDTPSCEVLERLSRQFELCAYGLREVRRSWEQPADDPPFRPFLIN